ncbi:hypothetical protein Pcaca05_00310 [Pectobacterium carotovorum subsp. carotovorum]|nr:hypothetical protein Pcaca05_00310 [Pectobacterium carotovorum subsp. carotovorum]
MLEPNRSHNPLIRENHQIISKNNKKEKNSSLSGDVLSMSSSFESLSFYAKKNENNQCHGGFISNLKSIFSFQTSPRHKEEDIELASVCLQGKRIMDACEDVIQANSSRNGKTCPIRLTPKQSIISGLLLCGAAAGGVIYLTRENSSANANASNGDTDFYQKINEALDMSIGETSTFCNIANEEYGQDVKIIERSSTSDLGAVSIFENLKEERVKREVNKFYIDNSVIHERIFYVLLKEMYCQDIQNDIQRLYYDTERVADSWHNISTKMKNVYFLFVLICKVESYIEKAKSEKRISRRYENFLKDSILGGLWAIAVSVEKEDMYYIDMLSEKHKKQEQKNYYENLREKVLRDKVLREKNNTSMVRDKRINLPKNKVGNEFPDKKNTTELDDVKKISLITCHNERENLTFTDKIRVVSKVLMNPISSLIVEGRITFKYTYLNEGCEDNNYLFKFSSAIENKINNLLSLEPAYANLMYATKISAYLLKIMADDIDGKELSIDDVDGLLGELNSLFKGVTSSLATSQIEKIANDEIKVSDVLSGFKYRDNQLYIETEEPPRLTEVASSYEHFFDKDKGGYLDYTNNWVVNSDIAFTVRANTMINDARKVFGEKSEITYMKNSSPGFYNDALILSSKNGLIVPLYNTDNMKTKFVSVKEVKFNDVDYRYLIKKDLNKVNSEYVTPIVFNGGRWKVEDKTSPVFDEAILDYIQNNEYIRNSLVSENIKHSDVSPLTLGRNMQFDKNGNSYLKINNKYFLLKMDASASWYIEGELNILPLENYKSNKMNGEFHIRNKQDGIIAMSRDELIDHRLSSFNEKIFLDESITTEVKMFDIGLLQEINSKNRLEISHSSKIEGAVSFEGQDYFNVGGSLVKVRKIGYDSYILGEDKQINQSVVIYKNERSNTYYLQRNLTRNGDYESKLNRRSNCVRKRQVFSLCDLSYSRTPKLTSLLKKNKEHVVKIDNPEETLEQFEGVNFLYNKKNKINELFYYYKDNLYFHAVESPKIGSEIVPSYITVYGKKENGEIDTSVSITDVSLIKKFDTAELLMSIPTEAQELILDLTADVSEKLKKWQDRTFKGSDITLDDFKKLPSLLANNKNLKEIMELFNKSGKKIIYPLNYINDQINAELEIHFPGEGDVILQSLDSAMKEERFNTIADVCDTAFKKSISILKTADSKSDEKILKYIHDRVLISSGEASNFFLKTIKNKIKRISTILNEKDRDNILLAVRNVRDEIDLSEGAITGVTMPGDPLDRIILNAFIIPEHFSSASGSLKKNYYINIMADTMLHEATHATGDKHDYAYINIDNIGRLDSIENAIAELEIKIGSDGMYKKFIDLSKIYLSSNSVYREFAIQKLAAPRILRKIFTYDPYFKGLVLLNNPDTVAIIIRDISELK